MSDEKDSGGMPATSDRSDAIAAQHGLVGWVCRTAPNLLVLVGLVALAVWGHRTGWTMPKFSAITSRSQPEKEDWCDMHGVPESQCVECQPGLLALEKDYGWCQKHGVPNCPWEHPDITQLDGRPDVSAADRERAERALTCAERPENNRNCKLQTRRIQFASSEAVERAGIEVGPVCRAPVTEAITANGDVSYDQTKVARLSSRVPGTVWRVTKQIGERVVQGEVCALVDAVEVGRAKAEFLQALVHLDLKTRTLEGLRAAYAAVPDRQLRDADAALREAEIRLATAEQALVNLGLPVRADDVRSLRPEQMAQRLQFLGVPAPLAQTLDPRTTTASLLPLRAPLDGVVVSRAVVAGEVVDNARVMFVIADTAHMWLTLSVRLEDARKVRLGQPVRFRAAAAEDEVRGAVAWIATAADEKTRTLNIRIDLANTDGRLAANTFGTGRVILRHEKEAIVVPSDAVHWEGCCHVVFVRDKDFLKEGSLKVFHTRKVQIGTKANGQTEILAGVLPGEIVATKGSGMLRAELLKNNLGEG
jgi:cobalt-zinc-cadmium efflux system membrane fusion protein